MFSIHFHFPHIQAKERICRLIQSGVDNGARLVLDGRNIQVLANAALSY